MPRFLRSRKKQQKPNNKRNKRNQTMKKVKRNPKNNLPSQPSVESLLLSYSDVEKNRLLRLIISKLQKLDSHLDSKIVSNENKKVVVNEMVRKIIDQYSKLALANREYSEVARLSKVEMNKPKRNYVLKPMKSIEEEVNVHDFQNLTIYNQPISKSPIYKKLQQLQSIKKKKGNSEKYNKLKSKKSLNVPEPAYNLNEQQTPNYAYAKQAPRQNNASAKQATPLYESIKNQNVPEPVYKTQATPLYESIKNENLDPFKQPEFVYDNPTTISQSSADLLNDVPRNNFYSIMPSNVKNFLGPKSTSPKRASARSNSSKSPNSSRFINVDGKTLKIIKETMLG